MKRTYILYDNGSVNTWGRFYRNVTPSSLARLSRLARERNAYTLLTAWTTVYQFVV